MVSLTLSQFRAKWRFVHREARVFNRIARAFRFVTLGGSFNILQNCSMSRFVTVRSSEEFRRVSIALSALSLVSSARFEIVKSQQYKSNRRILMINNRRYLFTSESVAEGHPDKVADQISDAVLDNVLACDPKARVDCETLVIQGNVIVTGQITTN